MKKISLISNNFNVFVEYGVLKLILILFGILIHRFDILRDQPIIISRQNFILKNFQIEYQMTLGNYTTLIRFSMNFFLFIYTWMIDLSFNKPYSILILQKK